MTQQKMVYYTPTYYSSLHDSITSLCNSILPFSKKRRIPASERKQSKLQSDNLKWQQDSFHQILYLMGLHKEGILAENEVSAFRCHLLETLVASPQEHEFPAILKDKLLFLQELLHAKCILEDEYHSSKRPLLQRLAVKGVEIEAGDVIVANSPKEPNESPEEEWSVMDIKDEKCLLSKANSNSNSKNKPKHGSAMKQIKVAASIFGIVSLNKTGKNREQISIFDTTDSNPYWIKLKGKENEPRSSQAMKESGSRDKSSQAMKESGSRDKSKRKPFKKLFQREQKEDETTPLPLKERSKSYKEPPSDKKVFGENTKKKLQGIQTELNTNNPNLAFSDDQIEAISTQLPVDKSNLKKFFTKSWGERYGDEVLNEVKNEFKDMGTMENLRATKDNSNLMPWTTFDDDDVQNCHPNLLVNKEASLFSNSKNNSTKLFETNPFSGNCFISSNGNNRLRPESSLYYQENNPFLTPRHDFIR